MVNVFYKEVPGIVMLHKDLKAGDFFVYAGDGRNRNPSVYMKIEEDGVLHTVDFARGHVFDDRSQGCLESKVIKLDALIFTCASKS